MESFKKYLISPKIIFVILGIVILVELVYAAKILTQPTPPPISKTASSVKTEEKLFLIATKTVYKVDELIPVSVRIDSRAHLISGADLIVNFDPKVIEVTPEAIIKGSFFSEYPMLAVDKNKGMIAISGVTKFAGGIKGVGLFARLNLKAKTPGKVSLTIAFNKGSTTDSNLVAANTSEDILESVGNLDLIIQ